MRTTMNPWNNKVVLITGAGRGGGRWLAQAFADRGAIVAANDISPVNVEQVVNEILAKGGRAKVYVEDVAKKVGAQNIVNQVEDDFNRLDILVNHAAVEPNIPLLEMDEWDWHRTLDVNLTGAFLMTQSAARVMRVRGGGVIINLITEAPPQETVPHKAAFLTSMKGLEGLTQQAARELHPYGIRVYAVRNVSETLLETLFTLLENGMEEQ